MRRSHRRRGAERDPRIERALVFLGEHRVAGGRRGAAAHRDVRVLGDVQRMEAARFGLARDLDRAHRAIGREDRDAELHRAAPLLGFPSREARYSALRAARRLAGIPPAGGARSEFVAALRLLEGVGRVRGAQQREQDDRRRPQSRASAARRARCARRLRSTPARARPPRAARCGVAMRARRRARVRDPSGCARPVRSCAAFRRRTRFRA